MIYRIEVSDGLMGLIHGVSYEMNELYVPELEICANLGGTIGQIFVFRDDGGRAKKGKDVKTVDLPDSLAQRLSKHVNEREWIKSELVEILS